MGKFTKLNLLNWKQEHAGLWPISGALPKLFFQRKFINKFGQKTHNWLPLKLNYFLTTLKFGRAYTKVPSCLRSTHFCQGHSLNLKSTHFARDIPSKKKYLTPAGLKSYKLLLVISVSPEMCIPNLEKMKSALRWSSENYKRNWEFELSLLTGGEVLEIKCF